MNNKCECPLAGFCNRHGVNKTEAMHKLCQTKDEFFQAWEECRGPRQTEDCVPAKSRGLGDTVAKIAKKTGVDKLVKGVVKAVTGSSNCGCNKRRNILNTLVPYNSENKDGDN